MAVKQLNEREASLSAGTFATILSVARFDPITYLATLLAREDKILEMIAYPEPVVMCKDAAIAQYRTNADDYHESQVMQPPHRLPCGISFLLMRTPSSHTGLLKMICSKRGYVRTSDGYKVSFHDKSTISRLQSPYQ